MEIALIENEVIDSAQVGTRTVNELSELQLALVGGGSADVILA